MTTTIPALQWSESVPPAEVRTGEQLDQLLNHLTATSRPEFPISVRLQAHGCEADILLGLPESFVHFNEVSQTRYFITVGDFYVDGVAGFHLCWDSTTPSSSVVI